MDINSEFNNELDTEPIVDYYYDIFGGDCPDRCSTCHKSYEWVRPGKSQPTCTCDDECSRCGNIKTCHIKENPKYPRVYGYYCDHCGP